MSGVVGEEGARVPRCSRYKVVPGNWDSMQLLRLDFGLYWPGNVIWSNDMFLLGRFVA
jgi:hypothetical protein